MKGSLVLLVVIYLAFISLGLPDSLLGAAWPAMYGELKVSRDLAGIISMTVGMGTVISSLLSAKVIRRFGVAAVTTSSVFMTAVALLGFSYSHQFIFLCLLAIPLGLGAGSVDAALNNYVALHYKAWHMNWLHCFWGIGAAIGPMIMSGYLARGASWARGYNAIGWMQILLVIILLFSFPLWTKNGAQKHGEGAVTKISPKALAAIPGFKSVLMVFFCYCAIESTFGLWGASYLVFFRKFQPDNAARLVSIYYIGITLGRFISGFITSKLSNRQMVYWGQAILVLGLIVLLLPFEGTLLSGFLLIGLGCAPIFPALLHETPQNFGAPFSQSMMGIQMAAAYVGIMLVPLLFGKLASYWGYASLVWFMAILVVVMIYMNYTLNRVVDSVRATKAGAIASLKNR